MRLTRMRRIERALEQRMRMEQAHAPIPTKHRIRRWIGGELLRFVERLERVLEGWRERCGKPRSLTWLRERATRLGGRVRATQAGVTAAVVGAGGVLAAGLTLAGELA